LGVPFIKLELIGKESDKESSVLKSTGLRDTNAACAGGSAKYRLSDNRLRLSFRNGMGCYMSGRFISAIAEQ
jgi:hypothetical protein